MAKRERTEAKRIADRERYEVLRDAGLCVGCKGTPEPGRVRCAACLASARTKTAKGAAQRTRRYKDRLEAEGICNRCGKREAGDTLTCRECREGANARLRAYRAAKRGDKKPRNYNCGICKKPGHDRRTCEQWRDDSDVRLENYLGQIDGGNWGEVVG